MPLQRPALASCRLGSRVLKRSQAIPLQVSEFPPGPEGELTWPTVRNRYPLISASHEPLAPLNMLWVNRAAAVPIHLADELRSDQYRRRAGPQTPRPLLQAFSRAIAQQRTSTWPSGTQKVSQSGSVYISNLRIRKRLSSVGNHRHELTRIDQGCAAKFPAVGGTVTWMARL
jgi:hypothetical protein